MSHRVQVAFSLNLITHLTYHLHISRKNIFFVDGDFKGILGALLGRLNMNKKNERQLMVCVLAFNNSECSLYREEGHFQSNDIIMTVKLACMPNSLRFGDNYEICRKKLYNHS